MILDGGQGRPPEKFMVRAIFWSVWPTIWSDLFSTSQVLGKLGHVIFHIKFTVWLVNKFIDDFIQIL